MYSYLKLANLPKSEISQTHITALIELASNDVRVKEIKLDKKTNTPSFFIKADEIQEGTYTLGAIANHLNKMPSSISAQIEAEKLPDIINIVKFMSYGFRINSDIRNLPTFTREKLKAHKETIEPSQKRAQCINILSYKLSGDETIAQRFMRDHSDLGHARRHAQILVDAGCANELNRTKRHFGTIVFEDGSTF